MQFAWDKVPEDQLRRMWEASLQPMNQAGNLMAPVPSMQQWALIADGQRALEELNRRANQKEPRQWLRR